MTSSLAIIATCLVSGALGFGIVWNVGSSSSKKANRDTNATDDNMQGENPPEPEEQPINWRKSVNRLWYELLDVKRSADAETIRNAYILKIAQYYPDRYRHSAPEIIKYSEEQVAPLNVAFAESKSSRIR